MSLQGFNYSEFGSLINTSCSNFTTIDLRNASPSVINVFTYYVSNFRNNPNHLWQFWMTLFSVSLFGLITNSSFILTVVRTPSLHSSTYILLTILACSDCISLIARLDQIAHVLFDYPVTNVGITVSAFFGTLCFLLSTGFVILASVERFLAICHPLTHHRLKGTQRTQKHIAIVFLISLTILSSFVPRLLSYSEAELCIVWPVGDEFQAYPQQILLQTPHSWRTLYDKIADVSLGVIFLLILAGVSYMYAQILATLAKRKRNTNLQMSAEFKKHIEQVSVMVIANGGVYFFLTSIYITYLTLISLSLIKQYTLGYWELAAYASNAVNASINPLLYFLTNERYRCAVKTMFSGRFKKTKTQLDSSNVAVHQL